MKSHNLKTRILIAWVLLLALMPFFVVKATHFHTYKIESHSSDEGNHSHHNCPICHFILSTFIVPEVINAPQPVNHLFNYTDSYLSKDFKICHHSFLRRGPPSVIF